MPDNRNFLIAIALSLAVLLGWQFFVAGPQMQKAQQQQEIAAQQAAENAPAPASGTAPASTAVGGAPVGSAAATALTREAALIWRAVDGHRTVRQIAEQSGERAVPLLRHLEEHRLLLLEIGGQK